MNTLSDKRVTRLAKGNIAPKYFEEDVKEAIKEIDRHSCIFQMNGDFIMVIERKKFKEIFGEELTK